jgi:hypothetical protein
VQELEHELVEEWVLGWAHELGYGLAALMVQGLETELGHVLALGLDRRLEHDLANGLVPQRVPQKVPMLALEKVDEWAGGLVWRLEMESEVWLVLVLVRKLANDLAEQMELGLVSW